MSQKYDGLDIHDLQQVARHIRGAVSLADIGSIHAVSAKEIQHQQEDQAAFNEACWIREALETLVPDVPSDALAAAIGNDPEAFRLIEVELLGIRARLIKRIVT